MIIGIGEVGLYTDDVVGLSDFYRKLLGIKKKSKNKTIQFIITEGTGLTIFNDGAERKGNEQNFCLAFTVDDVDAEFERLKKMGVTIVEPPTTRPWGARNMIFLDPAGNRVIFRTIPQEGK